MRLSPQDLDDWRAFLDVAPARMRTIIHLLMARISELNEHNRRQAELLESERLRMADLDRLVEALSGTRTREA